MNNPKFTVRFLLFLLVGCSLFFAGFGVGRRFEPAPVIAALQPPLDEPCRNFLFFYDRDYELDDFVKNFRQALIPFNTPADGC